MRDSRIENKLNQYKIEYDYVYESKLDEIEISDTARDNIRPNLPFNREVIRGYRTDIENSENGYQTAMAAVVLHIAPSGPKGFGLVDGMQRLAAAQGCGVDTVDAYVLQTDNENVITSLQRTLNTLNGWRTSETERIEQGLHLIQRNGYDPSDAERELSLRKGVLTTIVRNRKITGVLRDNGSTPPVTRDKIRISGLLLDRVEVMVAANDLRNDADLGATAYEEIVRAALSKGSDAAQLRVIAEYREYYKSRIEETRGGRVSLPGKRLRKTYADSLKLGRDIGKVESPECLTQEEILSQIKGLESVIKTVTDYVKFLRTHVK